MYFCPVAECKYKTLWPGNLRRHSAVHEKQQTGRNCCSLCAYRTARHNNVLRHLRLVHGGKGAVVKLAKVQKRKAQPKPVQEPAREPVLGLVQELKQEPLLAPKQDADIKLMPYQLVLDRELEIEHKLGSEEDAESETDLVFEIKESDWKQETNQEWVEELESELEFEYLPTSPNVENVIIWPTAAHWEASFYKRPASTDFSVLSEDEQVSNQLNTEKHWP